MILETATKRKTARIFKTDKIPDQALKYALKVAQQAPSGSNAQLWKYIVIKDADTKERVRAAAEEGERAFYESISPERKKWYNGKGLSPSKPNLTQAPVLIAVLGETTAPNYKPSVWVSIGYMILALEEQGLSTVTYTPSEPRLVSDAAGAPENYIVESMLPVGYSDDPKSKEYRKGIEELTFRDSWGIPF